MFTVQHRMANFFFFWSNSTKLKRTWKNLTSANEFLVECSHHRYSSWTNCKRPNDKASDVHLLLAKNYLDDFFLNEILNASLYGRKLFGQKYFSEIYRYYVIIVLMHQNVLTVNNILEDESFNWNLDLCEKQVEKNSRRNDFIFKRYN